MRQAEGRVARREHFCASAYLVAVPLWDSKATPAPRLREGVWRLITWATYNSNLAGSFWVKAGAAPAYQG